jgi:hypothetical protein
MLESLDALGPFLMSVRYWSLPASTVPICLATMVT